MLSLVTTFLSPDYQNLCPDDHNGSTGHRIIEFTEMFTYGTVVSVCHDDYGQAFSEAIGKIESACDGFTPVP